MTSSKNPSWKLVNLFTACLLIAGCAPLPSRGAPPTSIITPTEERQHVPLIGESALAPGTPWGFVDYEHFIVLTTGDYEGFVTNVLPASILTVVPGRIGIGPWVGNEMVFVYSTWAKPTKLSKSEFIEKTKAEVKKDLSPEATDIRDISSEYEERLKFWPGYMFGLAYKSLGRDYRVVHAFAIVPGPKPDSHVLHDFSYIRMEKPGAKDHFDDFVAMLRSVQFPAQPPGGIFKTYVGFPAPDTKWVVRITDSIHGTLTTMVTALGEGRYKGKLVYRLASSAEGTVLTYDEATANLITILRGEKETMLSFPHEGTFSWPLWVGKSWVARFTYYEPGQKIPIETHWKVEAYEDVQVAASTWKAFRLRGSWPGTTTTIWYAPEINLMVRRVFERTPDHPRGYFKVVTEVIEYPAK